jgi:hypothetical protein
MDAQGKIIDSLAWCFYGRRFDGDEWMNSAELALAVSGSSIDFFTAVVPENFKRDLDSLCDDGLIERRMGDNLQTQYRLTPAKYESYSQEQHFIDRQ